ncbi:MAG TPA: NBR1-Ig-like domain-containing protein [Anaerolineales bacterium]|nr:NBR1-Ig-like domain-containing protein [Anaerolineales bacterium]
MSHIRKITLVLFLLLLLTACVKVSGEAPTRAPVLFVTSTLPPYKPGLTVPTPVPPTASPTSDPLTASPTPSCGDSAVFVEDVTYPDNTRLGAGEKFTKTWKFQNTGGCAWKGYTVAFVSGDKMEAPDSVPVPETEAQSTVEVSIDLVAPSNDGFYTGNFELRNAEGKSIPLGTEPTFWVKIIVGEDIAAASTQQNIGNCTYTEKPEYVQTLIDLVNKSRADVGRAALTVNEKLTAAARAHSLDMACNNFMKHSGSDGSWTGDRLSKAGYTNPYYLEILAIGLPQDAMNQWKIEKNDWSAVLNSRVTEIGVGYVFSKFSAYGGYWTVDMGGK